MPDVKTKLLTPEWIYTAIVGFPGGHTDPSPAFVAAAADRVWEQMVALAELRGRDADGHLVLRLDVAEEVLDREPQS